MLLKLSTKSTINSIVLILFFIAPYTISGNINSGELNILYIILLCFYSLLTIFLGKQLLKKEHQNALYFAFVFIVFGIFNQLINNYTSYFNIIAPFIAYIGYIFTIKYKINAKVFIFLMVFNYLYFIILFYSNMPFNLLGPDVDSDDYDNFKNTSSNIIPCVLIINLYAYDVINKIKNEGRNEKIILMLAFINVLFIVIQRSRAGIIVSIIYLLFKLYYSYRKLFWIFLILGFSLIVKFFNLISLYLVAIGGMTSYSDFTQDARGLNIALFFYNLDFVSFFWGFGKNIIAIGQQHSTQPLFMNIWNYYGIFTLIIVVIVFAKRLLIRNRGMMPSIYLLPFLAYSVFEGFFFPNFWDFFIYLILFFKYDTNQHVNPLFSDINREELVKL